MTRRRSSTGPLRLCTITLHPAAASPAAAARPTTAPRLGATRESLPPPPTPPPPPPPPRAPASQILISHTLYIARSTHTSSHLTTAARTSLGKRMCHACDNACRRIFARQERPGQTTPPNARRGAGVRGGGGGGNALGQALEGEAEPHGTDGGWDPVGQGLPEAPNQRVVPPPGRHRLEPCARMPYLSQPVQRAQPTVGDSAGSIPVCACADERADSLRGKCNTAAYAAGRPAGAPPLEERTLAWKTRPPR